MFNKMAIGILVFLLVLTGTLGAYAFNLAEEVIRRLSRDFGILLDQINWTDDLQTQLSSLSVLASQLNVLIHAKS